VRRKVGGWVLGSNGRRARIRGSGESCKLVVDLLGSGDPQDGLNRYEKTNELRARQLASTIPGAKKILEDYGLWRII
jgi:hypothetical protein